ncbi:MAG TPA: AAA family ATPase, partial [Nocardioides sp.]
MSALPRPDLPPGAHHDLVERLHDLHHRAGWPSLRTIAREAGVSHTTVSKAFSHATLPTWGTLELLVECLGGDTAAFHDLWLAAGTPTDGAPAPVHHIAGRRAELDVVRRHLASGAGLLVVTGQAGIGKTRLVSAAAERAAAFVAVGHCLPLSTGVPLLPVIDVLR